MKNNMIETLTGALVLLTAAFFFWYAYENSDSETIDAFEYHATFDRVDGLVKGSDVRMSGVRVGIITALEIEKETYLAKISFAIDNDIKLPKDTSAEIVSDGLLGAKYLALVPGGDEKYLAEGNTIIHTQSSVNLESLIGQLIFSNKSNKPKGDEQ